jgi:hypothetical protein
MFFVIFPVLAIIAALIHLAVTSQFGAGSKTIASIFLRYLLLINVGLEGVFGFYGHAFMGDQIAATIGWAPSPFQLEVANANLAVAVLGILCWWFDGAFWWATIVATAVWLWGDAVVHIHEIIVAHNYAPNNAGPALYSDLIVPAVLIGLAIAARIPIRPRR